MVFNEKEGLKPFVSKALDPKLLSFWITMLIWTTKSKVKFSFSNVKVACVHLRQQVSPIQAESSIYLCVESFIFIFYFIYA